MSSIYRVWAKLIYTVHLIKCERLGLMDDRQVQLQKFMEGKLMCLWCKCVNFKSTESSRGRT